ncbi:MAG: GNAT superfamily N-acetyltransferase [Paraglaciecola sp.]|jgi:GNAT superfamily N-acetyltransferase
MEKIQYQQLAPQYFQQVLELATAVHGENYLDMPGLQSIFQHSFDQDINASWVAVDGQQVVGFRLTLAAPHWQPDRWCSSQEWAIEQKKLCYFKCNTVAQPYRGMGIGKRLLGLSIEKAKLQGCLAGLAHIWLASPNNSAYQYFSKCGGKTVKYHPGKWRELSIEHGYRCPVCPGICECVAAEMILYFNPTTKAD